MFSAKLIAQSGDPEWAIAELEKMENVLPGKYYIKFFMGSCCLSLKQPARALKLFEEALDLNPREEDIPSLYSYTGLCLKDLEHYKEAISTFEKAEAYDGERTDIYNLMGFCYYKLKEHEKAIQCFRKVLEIEPSSAIDYANIASNYREMGDKEAAIRYYRFALELDSSIDFARDNLRKLERDVGKLERKLSIS
jgi:ribosomal protein S12 methylthiotransferase accessory factor